MLKKVAGVWPPRIWKRLPRYTKKRHRSTKRSQHTRRPQSSMRATMHRKHIYLHWFFYGYISDWCVCMWIGAPPTAAWHRWRRWPQRRASTRTRQRSSISWRHRVSTRNFASSTSATLRSARCSAIWPTRTWSRASARSRSTTALSLALPPLVNTSCSLYGLIHAHAHARTYTRSQIALVHKAHAHSHKRARGFASTREYKLLIVCFCARMQT